MKWMLMVLVAAALTIAGCDDGKKTEGTKMDSKEIKKTDPGMGAGNEAPPARSN